jgi:hypothetical protein
MLVYVQALINIALRRLGPEDLPDSGFLLGLTVVAYVLLQLPIGMIADASMRDVVTQIPVSVVLAFTFVWVVLRLAGFPNRYRQTLAALLGTGTLLTIVAMPFMIWRLSVLQTQPAAPFPELVLLIIMLWSIAVDGHIIARALSRPFVVGLLVSIAYLMLYRTLLMELMPPPRVESLN